MIRASRGVSRRLDGNVGREMNVTNRILPDEYLLVRPKTRGVQLNNR